MKTWVICTIIGVLVAAVVVPILIRRTVIGHKVERSVEDIIILHYAVRQMGYEWGNWPYPDEAFQSILERNTAPQDLEEERYEFKFGNFSIVVPAVALGGS